MEDVKRKTNDFLIRHNMFYDQINLDLCLKEYIDEMQAGLTDRKSSLSMLPTYIFYGEYIFNRQKVISIDAGGTNLRIAIITLDSDGECRVDKMQKYIMPGFQKGITYDIFFETLAEYIRPFSKYSNLVSISFAYPTEITPGMDGKVLNMVKEIKIENVEGKLLGECLKNKLKNIENKDWKVYVTNDAAATCLAGITKNNENKFCSYIGFVLGTGMNTCYIEEVQNIKNMKSRINNEYMLINTESGNYNRQLRGDIDVYFDNTTTTPAQNSLEKMISGGYLGALLDFIIRFSKKEKLFSPNFYQAYDKIGFLKTIDINKFACNDLSRNVLKDIFIISPNIEDEQKLIYLIENLIKRGAKLVVLQLAGAAIKCAKKGNRDMPICITIEGSTYYMLKGLKDEVNNYLQPWLKNYFCINTKIGQIEDAVLKGASIAVLSGNC